MMENCFLKSADRRQVIHTRNLAHSGGYLNHPDLLSAREVVYSCKVLLDCIADVLQSLFLGGSLRPAAGKTWAVDADALF
jgi:hypothetical protein